MRYDPFNPGWTTIGEIKARGKGGAAPLDPNARLFKDRDISGIFALAKRDVASARKAAQDAGRIPMPGSRTIPSDGETDACNRKIQDRFTSAACRAGDDFPVRQTD